MKRVVVAAISNVSARPVIVAINALAGRAGATSGLPADAPTDAREAAADGGAETGETALETRNVHRPPQPAHRAEHSLGLLVNLLAIG